MKKILYSLLVGLSSVIMSSCDDDVVDNSKITHYVSIEIQGDTKILLPVGTDYVELGVVATEGDEDVTSSVKIQGEVNGNKKGLYTISYSATNVDGFNSSAQRTVIVYDPTVTTDISGTYTVADGTYRYALSTGVQVPYSGYPVTLTYVAPGILEVSDYMGGYYEKRAAYGASYAMKGYLSLNADNSLSMLSSSIAGWGDSLDKVENASYDPSTGTLRWAATYTSAYTFNVILNKN